MWTDCRQRECVFLHKCICFCVFLVHFVSYKCLPSKYCSALEAFESILKPHQPCHKQTVCSCQSEKSLLITSFYPWCSFNEIPRKGKLNKKKTKQTSQGLSPPFWPSSELFTTLVCVLCIVDFMRLARRSVLPASLPFSFCDHVNHTPVFCPLFLLLLSFPPPLLGLFCRLPPSLVSGCALTAIKRLPFMRNRSKDKDKAKAIYRRSMCKIAVSRHAKRPLFPLPPIPPSMETFQRKRHSFQQSYSTRLTETSSGFCRSS